MGSKTIRKKNCVKFTGAWFELDDFVKRHPGGPNLIQLFDGRDITNVFRSYHPQFSDSVLRSVLRKVKNEDTSSEEIKEIEQTKEAISDEVSEKYTIAYKDLQKDVLKALGGVRNSKGNAAYFIEASAIFGLAVALEASQWAYGFTLGRAVVLGWIMALVAFNIMHDANHGAASLNPNVNYYLGLTFDWVGGSAMYWKHHHNVLHHLHTKGEDDPDARYNPYFRIHPKDKPNIINHLQHLYMWPLFFLIQFRNNIIEPFELVFGYGDGNADHRFAEETKRERHFSLILKALFYLRFIILPLTFMPEWNTALCIAVPIAVFSVYTGFLAIISHNTIDTKLYPGNGYDEKSFMASQVEGSCNWGGWLAVYFVGGINCEYISHKTC
jgi:fatty acid desaturase